MDFHNNVFMCLFFKFSPPVLSRSTCDQSFLPLRILLYTIYFHSITHLKPECYNDPQTGRPSPFLQAGSGSHDGRGWSAALCLGTFREGKWRTSLCGGKKSWHSFSVPSFSYVQTSVDLGLKQLRG